MIITSIADEIFSELGEPDIISVPSISFWLSSNFGTLNNLITTSYILTNLEIDPELADNEKSIFKCLYFLYYFRRQVDRNLGAAAYNSFSEVTEGNRTVRRTNKNEIAKTFMQLLGSYQNQLDQEVLAYRMNGAGVTQFIVSNPNLFPNYPYGPTPCNYPWFGYGRTLE